jgi:hypothetical protein
MPFGKEMRSALLLITIIFAGLGCGKMWGTVAYTGSSTGVFPWGPFSAVWVAGNKFGNQNGFYGPPGNPANVPGSRDQNISWKDPSGNFWVFGDYGYDSVGTVGYNNDLWKYSPLTQQWTWVSGSTTANQGGTYGALYASSTGYIPGGRRLYFSWTDSAGIFWLFGGYGYDSTSALGYMNDLWKYNPSNQQWTWMSGAAAMSEVKIRLTERLALVILQIFLVLEIAARTGLIHPETFGSLAVSEKTTPASTMI